MAKILSLLSEAACCGRRTTSREPPPIMTRSKILARRKVEVWKPDTYVRIRELEFGNFGEIYVVKHKVTNDQTVLKIINTQYTDADQIEREKKSWEMTCDHPYIVTLRAYFTTPTTFNFVSDFMTGGSLFKVIMTKGPISLKKAKAYAGQIGSAIQHIHNKGITHRDISAKNVLIAREGDVRLTDFGFAMFKRCSCRLCGTPVYMAPEIIKQKNYDKNVDWWSYGIVIYLMLMGKTPLEVCLEKYPELGPLEQMDDNTMMKVALTVEVTFPKRIKPLARSFIEELLQKDPKMRLGSTNKPVKEHQFLEGAPWIDI